MVSSKAALNKRQHVKHVVSAEAYYLCNTM
jgi:hypothetical protein